jgi:NAD(P)-dependent dehydrogenase (short-subunit alcohol dehydrogenase family)
MQKNKWGRIITVGSVQQSKPHKDMLVYASTKEAQMNIVKNLAKQLAPWGITINNISPGVIYTDRNKTALDDSIYMKEVLNNIPCGYIGKPEDCVGSMLFLCSEEARYITGIDLLVDGGLHL